MRNKTLILLCILIALAGVASAQTFSGAVSGGSHKFVDPKIMDGNLNGLVKGGKTLTAEAGYEGYINKYKKLKVGLVIDYFTGQFIPGYSYNSYWKYDIECTRIGISISPYRFELAKSLILSPAIELNVLAISGGKFFTQERDTTISLVPVYYNMTTSDISRNIYNTFTAAATLSLYYKIPVGEKWYIAPNFRYYYGLIYELKDDRASIVSRRNQLGIIIGWK